MSKRRLYFTESQVVYICNEYSMREAPIGTGIHVVQAALGHFGDSLPKEHELSETMGPLGVAMSLLEEYTKRSLTYESDALNAISGALNTLQSVDSPIHHVWGMPFTRHVRDELTNWVLGESPGTQIALHWFHPHPVSRRYGFPSWSPLGWKGRVEFYEHNQPITPSQCTARISVDAKFVELDSLLAKRITPDFSSNASMYLQITALVAQLPLMEIALDHTTDGTAPQHRNTQVVAFPWNCAIPTRPKAFDVCISPRWDSIPPDRNEHNSILCAILTRGVTWWRSQEYRCIMVLLQDRGRYYERVGCVVYPKGPDSLTGGDRWQVWIRESWGLFPIKDESWLRGACWDEYEPTWLNDAVEKTFLLSYYAF